MLLLAAFALGPFALVPTALFAGIALLLGGANISAIGAATGPGLWAFVLAWLNRDGPGDVCTQSATSGSCAEEWAPWPFWLAGAILVLMPVLLYVRLRRKRARIVLA